ncbi:MAG: DUF748 domain-containing protein [Candidatus Omnitrophica bacterium]|nr:DUF748 domain-containing protein [Candidatus Omnitrophota bacterium]
MKKFIKVLIWLLVIFLAFFAAAGILLAVHGKRIVTSRMEETLKMPVKLDSIGLRLPFSVRVVNLQVGDLAKAKEISFTPQLLGLLAGKLVISDLQLEGPQFNLVKYPDGTLNLPVLASQSGPQLILTGLAINNGRFSYLDQSIRQEALETVMHKIDLRINKAFFPLTSLNAKINFSGELIDPQEKPLGGASAEGWIDFRAKDMDLTFKVNDLDITYFSAYYGDFISEKKLSSAKLNLLSLFKAKNNALAINSDLRLTDLVYTQEDEAQEAELPTLDFTKKTLDLFADANGNIQLNFTINTLFDRPQVSIAELKKAILQAAVQNLANQPTDQLINKISNMVEDFENFGRQMKDIFKNKE